MKLYLDAICNSGSIQAVRLPELHKDISLGDVDLYQHRAFSRVGAIVASFVSAECPVQGGGGDIRKVLEMGYLEHPGSAGCTDDMFENFVCFGRYVCCPLAPFCQQAHTMSAYKFTQQAVASPEAQQKPLERKRASSGGASWAQVSREDPGRKAKKPRTSSSQQPACTHKEHQILPTAEATAFANQFWDCTVHPNRLSEQKLGKYVPNKKHGDVCPTAPALAENDNDSDSTCLKCAVHICVPRPICSSVLKMRPPTPPPPPPHF